MWQEAHGGGRACYDHNWDKFKEHQRLTIYKWYDDIIQNHQK